MLDVVETTEMRLDKQLDSDSYLKAYRNA
jgi:hypothetical protein